MSKWSYVVSVVVIGLLAAHQFAFWRVARIELRDDSIIATNLLGKKRIIPFNEVVKLEPPRIATLRRSGSRTSLVFCRSLPPLSAQGLLRFDEFFAEVSRRTGVPLPKD